MGKKHKAWFYDRYIKRFFDIFISITGLVVLSPFALICAIAIKLEDPGGPVFFRQERNGKHGKVIKITKFRTMKSTLSGGDVVAHRDTLTRAGKVIRKLSLDEFPQFISILKGDMSLIGPRPLLLSYYEWFNAEERRRFDARPGLTGLSQINGRTNLNWDERFRLDVEYVERLSFGLDLKIFVLTFFAIFTHKDTEYDDKLENFDVYRKNQLEAQLFKEPRIREAPKETAPAFRSKSLGA
ncbi:MAG: sugar transferase [Christensenellales bacterium]